MHLLRRLLLALAFLVPVTVLAQDTAQEQEDKGFLTNFLQDTLSGAGRQVEITNFQGALSSRATIESLSIADAEGVWLTINDVVLDWNRSALFAGQVEINEFSAGEIIMPRMPAADESLPAPEAGEFRVPSLPVSVRIDEIRADRVELGRSVLGQAAVLSAEGSAFLDGQQLDVDILADRLDDKDGSFQVSADYDPDEGILTTDIQLSEEAGGIAATALNIPERPSVDLILQGRGPVSDFNADIRLSTGGEPRLTGTAGLAADAEGARAYRLDVSGDLSPLIPASSRAFFDGDTSLAVTASQDAAGALTLDQLALDAPQFTLEGSAALTPSGWPAALELTGDIASRDGTPVTLPFTDGATRVGRVDLDIAFDAAQDDGWTGRFTITALDTPQIDAETLVLDGGGTLTQGDGNALGGLTADLDFAAEGLAPADPGLAEALGAAPEGSLSIAWSEDAPLRLSALRVETAGSTLTGNATIDDLAAAFATELQLTLATPDLARFSRLAGQDLSGAAEISLSGTVEPPTGAFDLAVTGRADDLAIGQPQADALLRGRTTLDIAAVRNTTGIALDRLKLDNAALALDATGRLATEETRLDYQARLKDLARLSPDAEPDAGFAELAGTVRLDQDKRLQQLTAEGRIAHPGEGPVRIPLGDTTLRLASGTLDLTAIPETGEIDFSTVLEQLRHPQGSAERLALTADAQITQATTGDLLRALADLTFSAEGLAPVDPALAEAIGPEVTGTATVDYRPDQPLTITDARVTGPGVTLSGRATVGLAAPRPADFAVTLTAEDLSRFSALAGRDLSGAAEIAIGGNAQIDGGSLSVSANGTTRDLGTGIAQIDPLLAGQTTIDTAIGLDGTRLTIEALSVRNDRLALAARGQAATDSGDFDLSAELTGRDLPTGNPIGDSLLAGETTVETAASREGDTLTIRRLTLANPRLDARVNGTADLATLDFDLAANVTGTDLSTGIDVADRILAGRTTLAAAARREGETLTIRQLDLATPRLEASATGSANLETLDFDLTTDAEATDLRTGIDIADRILAGRTTLTASARREGEVLTLRSLDLDNPRLDLTASGTANTATLDFDVTASGTAQDLPLGNPTADRLLAGTTRFDADLSRTEGQLRVDRLEVDGRNVTLSASGTPAAVTYDAALRDLAVLAPDFPGRVTASGSLRQAEAGAYAVDTSLTGPGGTRADASGSIGPGSTVNLTANGSAPLGLVNPFLGGQRLGGTATFDLAINGRPALENLTGRISTRGAQLSVPDLRFALSRIDGDVTLSGGSARLDIRGDVAQGGRITVTGPVSLQAPFSADLDAALNALIVRQADLYEAEIGGRLAIEGPLAGGATIRGRLGLDRAEIQVPSTGLTALGDIPAITHVGDSAAVERTRARAGIDGADGANGSGDGGGGGPAYPLDIRLAAPGRIFVRGRGLDAELGGELRLTGTTANVIPAGRFNLIRGRLDILTQRFELTEGNVQLVGNFDPFLRLVATTTKDGTEISIVVEGPASEPEISFLSSPELPQEEVLALLIFDRSLTKLSPFQALQLASAVATLAGRGGTGILGRLRENFGLDDLDVTTDEEGNTAVRAGKYISENVYSDVTVDSTGEAQIDLNLDLNKNVTVKAGQSSDGNSSVGIFFEKDY